MGNAYIANLEGPEIVPASVEYAGSGLYEVHYETPSSRLYSLSIEEAHSGGLHASYWNNRWLFGDPVAERIDPMINFFWAEDELITYFYSLDWLCSTCFFRGV